MSLRFTNLLRDLIVESSRFQVLFDKFVKPKERGQRGIMPFETLFALIAADPTTKVPEGMDINNVKPEQMEKVKIGKYAQWLIKNFITPKLEPNHPLMVLDPQSGQYKSALKEFQELFMEDLYKVTTNLQKYERFKNRLSQEYRDINKLTPETLFDQVKDFSLEKTKATAAEKKEASTTYAHPGADIVYRGQDWTVAKISDKGPLGKEAACFYGGSHNEGRRGETTWCTSSPGLSWFDRYIGKGPLYVVIPNKPTSFKSYGKDVGDVSGLPANRYQFHFPDNQFMDADDRQINLIEFLNTNEEGLKQFFKPEFMKSLAGDKGEKVVIDYPSDSASKFIALYGFDEFFATLPETLKRLTFKNTSRDKISLNIPNDIGRFKQLNAINFVGCVASIPDAICGLQNLQYLSLVNNPDLQMLPECVGDMPNLMVLNLGGSDPKKVLPQSVFRRAETDEDFNLFTHS
jgi:Leucine-rich repeat (LRR) protein